MRQRDERDFINACIATNMKGVTAYRASTHPLEYQMHYSIRGEWKDGSSLR